jgi:Lon protease-like protein
MTEIALFPIPDCVTFPGTSFPLHVFEPRYRAMIKHCLDNDMLLGVCHTQKIVSPAKQDQSIDEALQTNQATYKPYNIFSAGKCELLKTLEDGRMYLKVNMESRYKAIKEIQTLPFTVFKCEPYYDKPIDQSCLAEAEITKEKVLKRLQVMTNNIPDAQELLLSEEWVDKELSDFSFEIFGLLQFDADLQQEILEMTSIKQRLDYLLDLLNAQN